MPTVLLCVGDGLSSAAVEKNAAPLMRALTRALAPRYRLLNPIFIRNARVRIEDHLGEILRPDVVCMIVGERPGLVTAESLSAYVIYRPTLKSIEPDRTVISNIHRGGIPIAEAARKIAALIDDTIKFQASGAALRKNSAATWRARYACGAMSGRCTLPGACLSEKLRWKDKAMSDRESVLAANRAFYDAFESLDAEKMEAVWLKDPRIICIHPGHRKLSGWGPIMASWEAILDNVFEMKFELGEIEVMISGDLAIVVVEENLTQRGYDGTQRVNVLATNVFERVGNAWFMVMHHGSPVVATPDDEPPLQ